MSMSRVDDDGVDTGTDEEFEAFLAVTPDTDSGPNPQTADVILAGVGVFADFFDICGLFRCP